MNVEDPFLQIIGFGLIDKLSFLLGVAEGAPQSYCYQSPAPAQHARWSRDH